MKDNLYNINSYNCKFFFTWIALWINKPVVLKKNAVLWVKLFPLRISPTSFTRDSESKETTKNILWLIPTYLQ